MENITSNVASRSLTNKAYANQDDCNGINPFKSQKANLGSFKFGPHIHMRNADITKEFNSTSMVTILYKYYACLRSTKVESR